MPIPYTLLGYIFREMGKTFALAGIAMTIIFGLGVGVAQLVKLGEVTPWQLVQLLALVLPVAAALTLPIAALFSAAATYGRLSADNEFVACRSSGINMHVLLLPTLVLSLVSAAVTFGFNNFVIPKMARNLGEFVGTDVGTIIEQRLKDPRGIAFGSMRIHADGCYVDPENANRAALEGIAFVEVDGDDWVRYGTAKGVQLEFEKDVGRLLYRGHLTGLSYYDRESRQFLEEQFMAVPQNYFRSPVSAKVKYLSLWELLEYSKKPTEWVKVHDKLLALRGAIGQVMIFEHLIDMWKSDGRRITLFSDRCRFELVADVLKRDPSNQYLNLEGVEVTVDDAGVYRSMTADRATIDLLRGQTFEDCWLQVKLTRVMHHDAGQEVEEPEHMLRGIHIPQDVRTRVEAMSDTDLLAPDPALGASDPVAKQLKITKAAMEREQRKIIGSIHERMSLSLSVFVLVILGAMLGIVFRRAHLVVTFGISFIPSILLIITIGMGQQMANNEPTHTLGLATMWGSIGVVALADLWVMTRVLRR